MPLDWNISCSQVGAGPETVSTEILHRDPEALAPEGIAFRATVSDFPGVSDPTDVYDERTHKVQYLWSFPTLGSSYSYLQRTFGETNNPQVALGRDTFRVFPDGTHPYSVTAVSWVNGTLTTATANGQVVVGSPDYSGDKTIFVGPAANATAAGITGATVVSTLSAALTAAEGRGIPLRIMLDDDTFTVAPFEFNGAHSSIFLDGLGDAKLLWDGTSGSQFLGFDNFDSAKTKHFKLGNVTLEGLWDVTTETGSSINGIRTPDNADQPGYWLLTGSKLQKFSIPIYPNSFDSAPDDVCMLYDTQVTEWRGMGMLANTGHIYIAGARWAQNVNGLSGGPRGGAHNDHGPIRIAACTTFVCVDFDMTSHNGWFTNWKRQSDDVELYTRQPVLRIYTTPTLNSSATVNHGVAEGSIACLPANGSLEVLSRNIDISHIISVNDFTNGRMWNLCGGGVSIRNCILIWPQFTPADTIVAGSGGDKVDRSLLYLQDDGFTINAQSLADPIFVEGNTLIYQNSEGLVRDPIEQDSPSGYTNVTLRGNIVRTDLPLDVSDLTLSTPFAWEDSTPYRAYNLLEGIAGTEVPSGTASMVTPNSDSPEVSSVSGNPTSAYDILMQSRSVPDTAGAKLP